MKVLFLSPKFYPEIGGVEKHVLELSHELLEKGFEVSVVTEYYHWMSATDKGMHVYERPDISGKTESENVSGILVHRFDFGALGTIKKFRIWKTLWQHRSLIEQADVVHCHDVFIWYLPFRLLFPGKKVFTTFHGWEGIYPPRISAKLIRKVSEKLSFGNVCVGMYIEKWYGTKATYITYGAVSKFLISNVKYPMSNGKKKKLKILFVGRISEDNGVGKYVEILKKLQDLKISFEFQAIGDGELRKAFEKFGNVLGFVENTTDHIQQADIIFASSYLSILESLIQKKLVISVYENPLKKDYLEMTPFVKNIVIASNSQQAIDKITEFMNNKKETNQFITGGSEWAQKQTWEKLANQYIQLWNT